MIRHATETDLPRILEIYDIARRFMRQNGNMVQWVNGYPSEPLLRQDIANGDLYVMEDSGGVYCAFALVVGDDPTYAVIDGAWQDTATPLRHHPPHRQRRYPPGCAARVHGVGSPADIPPAGGHPRRQSGDAALHPAGGLHLLRRYPCGGRHAPCGL